ncbi:MAG: hypothetical protein ACLP0A_14175 [Verrucomicrobiia bacterium]
MKTQHDFPKGERGKLFKPNPPLRDSRTETPSMKTHEVARCIELVKTGLTQVKPGYFKLKTTYEPSGIVRERVFCYELYHKVRSMMKDDDALSLNGEIDKRGHRDFKKRDQKNPDFVFHIPGEFAGNTVIVEVKGSVKDPSGILKDFAVLLRFIKEYQYLAGIFILYNHSFSELVNALGGDLVRLSRTEEAESVYVLCIQGPGGECEEHILSELSSLAR